MSQTVTDWINAGKPAWGAGAVDGALPSGLAKMKKAPDESPALWKKLYLRLRL